MSILNFLTALAWPRYRNGAVSIRQGEPFADHHFKGILDNGRKFVYCPVGSICSWHPEDYNHEWCHWCEKYFSEIESPAS